MTPCKLPLTLRALFRYQVVSEIRIRLLTGWSKARAIRAVLAVPRLSPAATPRSGLSMRSLYRWLRAYEEGGVDALEPKARARAADSVALSRPMVRFLESTKLTDPDASVPEVIRLARAKGIIKKEEKVSRTTVWRACRRMGLAVRKAKKSDSREMRRFAHPHRMMMVLADGKHFRAGIERLKRVALIFIDDATRFGLGVVVAKSEDTVGFLTGLYQVIRTYGLMVGLYLDHGPGFASSATQTVVSRLDIALILGEVAYPEGHGKVERFNRTAKAQVLRTLEENPSIDADPGALTLLLSHWLTEYNHTPHEGLGGDTPAARWQADSRALEYPSGESFKEKFTVSFERKVTNDNVVSVDGVAYDMPLGYRRQTVLVTRHLLDDDALTVPHEGKALRLAPVDLAANARLRRARLPKQSDTEKDPQEARAESAAEASFAHDYQPLVDADGGYRRGDSDND